MFKVTLQVHSEFETGLESTNLDQPADQPNKPDWRIEYSHFQTENVASIFPPRPSLRKAIEEEGQCLRYEPVKLMRHLAVGP